MAEDDPLADDVLDAVVPPQALDAVHVRIAACFHRREMRERARRYLAGLLGRVERKNSWQLAEALGESGPQGVQRLFTDAGWDAEAVRDALRAYVVEQLGDAASGVLVVDETGFLKKGAKSAGVARQYSGTAGRRENQQIGVFLLYASEQGAAFLDRALYLPEAWAADARRRTEAHIPPEVAFTTKGELARGMLSHAFAAEVPAQWVVGDTVYGSDELRGWLEGQDRSYVLGVPSTHAVWSRGRARTVAELAAVLPARAWARLSAGQGSQGPRLYDWAWVQLPYVDGAPGRTQWLLIRRSLPDIQQPDAPPELKYYRAYGPEATALDELVRVAGRRWTIEQAFEQAFEQAKGEVGLDEYEVRRYDAWGRHSTLALLAHAALEVTRAHLTQATQAAALKGEAREQPTSLP
jgi:SRSO17 transposase